MFAEVGDNLCTDRVCLPLVANQNHLLMPDVATQAHRGLRSQGSDHGSKSQLSAQRSEQGRDIFPRLATQPEKGCTTLSSARTKPG